MRMINLQDHLITSSSTASRVKVNYFSLIWRNNGGQKNFIPTTFDLHELFLNPRHTKRYDHPRIWFLPIRGRAKSLALDVVVCINFGKHLKRLCAVGVVDVIGSLNHFSRLIFRNKNSRLKTNIMPRSRISHRNVVFKWFSGERNDLWSQFHFVFNNHNCTSSDDVCKHTFLW